MSCATTDVQEVGWLASLELDGVHGSHGKASAISENADIPSGVNVLQIEGISNALLNVDLRTVLLGLQFGLPVQSIVVNDDSGASSHYLLVSGVHQRVQLNDLCISLDEAVVEVLEQEDHL